MHEVGGVGKVEFLQGFSGILTQEPGGGHESSDIQARGFKGFAPLMQECAGFRRADLEEFSLRGGVEAPDELGDQSSPDGGGAVTEAMQADFMSFLLQIF